MQEHPVPQNVLEIEFKLFGNFSVRQFTRILLGCALALGLYVLNLPAIISWPLIVVVILYGLGSAMIKNFDAKANTLISAVIVSPRYIWRKDNNLPDYLTKDYQKKVIQDGTDKASKAAGIAVRDLEVDELIRTRTQRREQAAVKEEVQEVKPQTMPATAPVTIKVKPKTNQELVNSQPLVVKSSNELPSVSASPTESLQSTNTTITTQSPPPEVSVADATVAVQPKENDADLVLRLNELKGQLIKMQKVGASKVELDIVMKEIDAIYQKLKILAPDKFAQTFTDNYSQVMSQTNFLYGIVVDRKDRPISGVKVKLVGSDNQVYAEVESQNDGRFETPRTIPYGSYTVEVAKGGFRFDKFRVEVNEQKLPAYKFRSK